MAKKLRAGVIACGSIAQAMHLPGYARCPGIELVAASQPHAKGLGHRRHSPHRLAAKALLTTTEGRMLIAVRTGIERSFGNITSFAGGLGPLPAWVRRPHRVALWVAAKLIIDATRRIALQQRRQTG